MWFRLITGQLESLKSFVMMKQRSIILVMPINQAHGVLHITGDL